MTGTPLVVLDACVLANFSLCDTLLRLAEPPRLFEPKWSEEIVRETTRTLESKLQWPSSLTAHFEADLRVHFSEAWISGYDQLISRMTNDDKDRHVVAAAVHGGAAIIVTFNLRHFRPKHLEPWGIAAQHPQSFLSEVFRQEQALVMAKLEQQAADRGKSRSAFHSACFAARSCAVNLSDRLTPPADTLSLAGPAPDGPVICRNGIVQVVSPDKVTASQCRSAAKEVIAAWNFDLETMHWTKPERVDQPITLRLLSDERVNPQVRASANPNGRVTVRLSLINDPSLLSTFAHELGHIQADRTMGSNVSKVPDYYFEGHGLLMNWLYSDHIGRDHRHGAAGQAKTIMTLTPDVAQKLLTDPDYDQKHITSMERLGLFFVEYLRVRQNAPDAVTSIRKVFELVGQNRTFEQAFSKTYGLPLTRAIQDVVDLFQQTQAHPADRLKGTCFERYVSQ